MTSLPLPGVACDYDVVTITDPTLFTADGCQIGQLLISYPSGVVGYGTGIQLLNSDIGSIKVANLALPPTVANGFELRNCTVGLKNTVFPPAVAVEFANDLLQWQMMIRESSLHATERALSFRTFLAATTVTVLDSRLTVSIARATTADWVFGAYFQRYGSSAAVLGLTVTNSVIAIENPLGLQVGSVTALLLAPQAVFNGPVTITGSTIRVSSNSPTFGIRAPQMQATACFQLAATVVDNRCCTGPGSTCVCAHHAVGLEATGAIALASIAIVGSTFHVQGATADVVRVQAVSDAQLTIAGSALNGLSTQAGGVTALKLDGGYKPYVLLTNNTVDLTNMTSAGAAVAITAPVNMLARENLGWLAVAENVLVQATTMWFAALPHSPDAFMGCNSGGAVGAVPATATVLAGCSGLPAPPCGVNGVVANLVSAHSASTPSLPPAPFPSTAAPLGNKAVPAASGTVISGQWANVTITDPSGTLTFAPDTLMMSLTIGFSSAAAHPTAAARLVISMSATMIANGWAMAELPFCDVTIADTSIGVIGNSPPGEAVAFGAAVNVNLQITNLTLHASLKGLSITALSDDSVVAIRDSQFDVTTVDDTSAAVKSSLAIGTAAATTIAVSNTSLLAAVAALKPSRIVSTVHMAALSNVTATFLGCNLTAATRYTARVVDIGAAADGSCVVFEESRMASTCCAALWQSECTCSANNVHAMVYSAGFWAASTLTLRANHMRQHGYTSVAVDAQRTTNAQINLYGNDLLQTAVGAANRGVVTTVGDMSSNTHVVAIGNTVTVPNGIFVSVGDAPEMTVLVGNTLASSTQAFNKPTTWAHVGCNTGGTADLSALPPWMSSCGDALPYVPCGSNTALQALVPHQVVPRGTYRNGALTTVLLTDCAYATVEIVAAATLVIDNCDISAVTVIYPGGPYATVPLPMNVTIINSRVAAINLGGSVFPPAAGHHALLMRNATMGQHAYTRANYAVTLPLSLVAWDVDIAGSTILAYQRGLSLFYLPATYAVLVAGCNITVSPRESSGGSVSTSQLKVTGVYLPHLDPGATATFVDSAIHCLNHLNIAEEQMHAAVFPGGVYGAVRFQRCDLKVLGNASHTVTVGVNTLNHGACVSIEDSTLFAACCEGPACGACNYESVSVLVNFIHGDSSVTVAGGSTYALGHIATSVLMFGFNKGDVTWQGVDTTVIATGKVDPGYANAAVAVIFSTSSVAARMIIANNSLALSHAYGGSTAEPLGFFFGPAVFSSETRYMVLFRNTLVHNATWFSTLQSTVYMGCNDLAGAPAATPASALPFANCSYALPLTLCGVNGAALNEVLANRPPVPTLPPRPFPSSAPLVDRNYGPGPHIVVAGEWKDVVVTDPVDSLTIAPGAMLMSLTVRFSAPMQHPRPDRPLTFTMTNTMIGNFFSYAVAPFTNLTVANSTVGVYGNSPPATAIDMRHIVGSNVSFTAVTAHATQWGFLASTGVERSRVTFDGCELDVTTRSAADPLTAKGAVYVKNLQLGSLVRMNASVVRVHNAYAFTGLTVGLYFEAVSQAQVQFFGNTLSFGSQWTVYGVYVLGASQACALVDGNALTTTCCADPADSGECTCAPTQHHDAFRMHGFAASTMTLTGNVVRQRGYNGAVVGVAACDLLSYLNLFGNDIVATAVGANLGLVFSSTTPRFTIIHNNRFTIPNGHVLDATTVLDEQVVMVNNTLSPGTALLKGASHAKMSCITGGTAFLPIGHPAWLSSCAEPLPYVACGPNLAVMQLVGFVDPPPRPTTTAAPGTTAVPSTGVPAVPPTTTAAPPTTLAPTTTSAPATTGVPAVPTTTPAPASTTVITTPVPSTVPSTTTAAPGATTVVPNTTEVPTEVVVTPTGPITGQTFGRMYVVAGTSLIIKHSNFYELSIQFDGTGIGTSSPAIARRAAASGYTRTIVIENCTVGAGGLRFPQLLSDTSLTILSTKVESAPTGLLFGGGVSAAFVKVTGCEIHNAEESGIVLGTVAAGATVEIDATTVSVSQTHSSSSRSTVTGLSVTSVAATSSVLIGGSAFAVSSFGQTPVSSTSVTSASFGCAAASLGAVQGDVTISAASSFKATCDGGVGVFAASVASACLTLSDTTVDAHQGVVAATVSSAAVNMHRVSIRLASSGATGVRLLALASASVNVYSSDIRAFRAGVSAVTGVSLGAASGGTFKAFVYDTSFAFTGVALASATSGTASGVAFVANTLSADVVLAAAAIDRVYVACGSFNAPGWAKTATGADCGAKLTALPEPCADAAAYDAALAAAEPGGPNWNVIIIVLIVLVIVVIVAALVVRHVMKKRRLQEEMRQHAGGEYRDNDGPEAGQPMGDVTPMPPRPYTANVTDGVAVGYVCNDTGGMEFSPAVEARDGEGGAPQLFTPRDRDGIDGADVNIVFGGASAARAKESAPLPPQVAPSPQAVESARRRSSAAVQERRASVQQPRAAVSTGPASPSNPHDDGTEICDM
jgi:hypothetical protein